MQGVLYNIQSGFIYMYYRIDGIFCGEKFLQISRFRKNYTQKTKFYMAHTLFLTDLQKFNPAKYTTYTVCPIPQKFPSPEKSPII